MTETFVKVRFELDVSDWHGHGSETLWATPTTESETRLFQIRNSPFFTRGINHLDVVRARKAENDKMFDFAEIIERSGHSTYMLLMRPDDARHSAYWNMLETLGCSYESGDIDLSIGNRLLYSVDVPPTTDRDEVRDILERGEGSGVWMFQEGYVNTLASSSKDQ
jgi:Domain of unknown function (DUF4265)